MMLSRNCHCNMDPMTMWQALQTEGRKIVCKQANGFNADTAVEALEKEFPYWTECSAMRQMEAILMPTMRTSLLLLNHQRLWSPTNSSISHLHWLLGKRNSYWFHAALKRCLSQVASCTHLWEAIGAAALSFLIVFNDMGPIVYVFVKWVLPPLALQT